MGVFKVRMLKKQTGSKLKFHPYFALVIGVIAVSTGAIFVRLAEAPALVIAAYRVGIAVLVVMPAALWKARRELSLLTKRDFTLSALSGVFLAFHFAFWISSLDYTSVASSVILVNTNPVWVALLAPVLAAERISRAFLLSAILSVIGAVIMGAGDFTVGPDVLWGDFLALIGSACAALYLLLGRRLRKKLSVLAYVCVCYTSAAIVLWAGVLMMRLPITGFKSSTWVAFLALAFFTQLTGHTSYNWALGWLSAGLIAVSLLGEPIGSTILAYILFDEGLTWMCALGGGLILIAIYVAAVNEEAVQDGGK